MLDKILDVKSNGEQKSMVVNGYSQSERAGRRYTVVESRDSIERLAFSVSLRALPHVP